MVNVDYFAVGNPNAVERLRLTGLGICGTRLTAANALATGTLSTSELDAAIAVMHARSNSQVTPTSFGTLGRRQA